ncbi:MULTISPECIES: hypothetical protein [Pseudomonas]|uniref:Uncharacterized protein n=1 Tax=Pseudomonas cedrina TaxID=651740 RepID=A0A2S9DZL0_PSECE|nr:MULTISPECIES: hypothetical protein [Pseudomonas]AVJ25012.1 hypothetical protein CLM72_26185 [Pseudomonas sp. MYb193]MBY8951834.1 hypothetical protein [Pseudomonas carnis]PRC08032.1 hypothetical protein CQ006_05795 [Pseudomonas cedrina]
MNPRLTGNEIAKIQTLLNEHVQKKGPSILGAQLGQCIRRAISPKSIKFIGNLRSLVDIELRELLSFVEALPSDSLYLVSGPGQGPITFNSEFVPAAGAKLWESFSNPTIDCLVGVDSAGVTYVTTSAKPFGADFTLLKKMTSDEFYDLAQVFANEQKDIPLQAALYEALDHPNFYSKWIAALRAHRSTANFLRTWEIKRTELVIARLQEELERAGLGTARAVVIANDIRPKPARSVAKPAAVPAPKTARQPEAPTAVPGAESNDLEELRAVMHRAIDKMSLADLKDIRVPAGLLLEIFQEQAD